MPISAPYSLTRCRRFFAEPATARQRQYEALRAFYLERLPSAEVARRFGYSPGAFRVPCHAFRHADLPGFFAAAHPGPREQPKKSRAHEQIVALRKRNYSVYEISQALKEQGTPLSATAVREVLAEEGFAPLPRRLDEERPARVGPNAEAVANVQDFILTEREFTTRMGGLFLFVPDLVRLDGDDALAHGAKLPGSRMIPAAHALRAALALKLWSIERKSHIMALVADEGLALFCGLNVMPKKSFLSEYSSRITPQQVSRLLAGWHAQLAGQELLAGQSLNLDWKRQYGTLPRHLGFDSKLTTYDRLDRLDAAGITFITLRRRSPSLLAEIDHLPPSAWRTVNPGPPDLPRPHRHAGRRRHHRERNQGALPPPRPSSHRPRLRSHR